MSDEKYKNRSRTIIRIEKVNNYTPVHRYPAEDKRLSWEARGVHYFLLVKPDNWQVCLSHLINSSPAGRDKVRRIINELVKYSYITKRQNREKHGQFSVHEYIVYELPHDGYFDDLFKPKTENPSTVKPPSDKPSPSKDPLLSIQTKPSIQVTKNTTTTNIFVWSAKISNKHQESILSLINEIDNEPAQLLLDELAGQIDNIKNPVGYFRTLLQAYLTGDFVPAKALQTQAKRKTRLQNKLAVERSQKAAEEQLQFQMNQLTGNSNE